MVTKEWIDTYRPTAVQASDTPVGLGPEDAGATIVPLTGCEHSTCTHTSRCSRLSPEGYQPTANAMPTDDSGPEKVVARLVANPKC